MGINMKNKWIAIFVFMIGLTSCKEEEKREPIQPIIYESFRDSVMHSNKDETPDDENVFDTPGYAPGIDSLKTLLENIEAILERDSILMAMQLDTMKKSLSNDPGYSDTEKAIIKENIRMVDSFLSARKDTSVKITCREKDCMLFAEIDKSKQLMYVYLLGELKDSFKVSTGLAKKYETPAMSLRPYGPVLTKYTSKKFPGGNYLGLGNMPYAVFLQNGYAIHGTTTGNFSKLGTRASHGCVRLHPDNAKIFNALVKTVGLNNTWVSIRDSIATGSPGVVNQTKE